MLADWEREEVAALVERYGQPERWQIALTLGPRGTAEWLEKKRRREVVLVIPRPQGRVLVHTKDFYLPGLYRLPTGGLHSGESLETGFRRELGEETGLQVPLARFLGIVEYRLKAGDRFVPFTSYILQTECTAEPLRAGDLSEQITDWRELGPDELRDLAQELETLADPWTDWGRFRAPPHRLVAETMRLG